GARSPRRSSRLIAAAASGWLALLSASSISADMFQLPLRAFGQRPGALVAVEVVCSPTGLGSLLGLSEQLEHFAAGEEQRADEDGAERLWLEQGGGPEVRRWAAWRRPGG